MSIVNNSNCFTNIITLKGTCDDSVSTSGFDASYLGITPEFLSQVITSDYEDVNDLFDTKLSQAIELVANTLYTQFSPKYRTVSVIDNFRTGKYLDNKQTIAPFAGLKGFYFDLCSEKSYLDFYASRFDLFCAYSGTVPILVIDLIEGKIIDTVNLVAVSGEIASVFPSSLYPSNKRKLKLFICYDATAITSYKGVLKESDCASCQPTHKISGTYEEIATMTIATGDPYMVSSLRVSADSGGLSIVHSLQCNHKDWLCSIANQLALPILYKTGSLIFEMALTECPNTRLDTTTINNSELLKARYDLSNSKFSEAMNNLVQSIEPPNDPNCFVCKKKSRHAIILP